MLNIINVFQHFISIDAASVFRNAVVLCRFALRLYTLSARWGLQTQRSYSNLMRLVCSSISSFAHLCTCSVISKFRIRCSRSTWFGFRLHVRRLRPVLIKAFVFVHADLQMSRPLPLRIEDSSMCGVQRGAAQRERCCPRLHCRSPSENITASCWHKVCLCGKGWVVVISGWLTQQSWDTDGLFDSEVLSVSQ